MDETHSAVELVKLYLRGQNLEQLGRTDEAVALYERTLEGRFDSSGPYDRLIALYSSRAAHADVARVAGAALDQVHTHDAKRAWYRTMLDEAEKAFGRVPRAAARTRPSG